MIIKSIVIFGALINSSWAGEVDGSFVVQNPPKAIQKRIFSELTLSPGQQTLLVNSQRRWDSETGTSVEFVAGDYTVQLKRNKITLHQGERTAHIPLPPKKKGNLYGPGGVYDFDFSAQEVKQSFSMKGHAEFEKVPGSFFEYREAVRVQSCPRNSSKFCECTYKLKRSVDHYRVAFTLSFLDPMNGSEVSRSVGKMPRIVDPTSKWKQLDEPECINVSADFDNSEF